MKKCCEFCFENKHLIKYILNNGAKGDCDYCGAKECYTIDLDVIGEHMRDCIAKAYEDVEAGTGAYYDSEEKTYCGRTGGEPTLFSIREILEENECVLSTASEGTTLLDDIFEESGPSIRDTQHGEIDYCSNLDDERFVIRDDLWGYEATRAYLNWEEFKYLIRHYNRFFDMNDDGRRESLLERLRPLLFEFCETIPSGASFYRARKGNNDNQQIIPKSFFGPPPTQFAKNNRMNPSGIPYLYVSSDEETTVKECRCERALIAKFVLLHELQVIDFSKPSLQFPDSIFSDVYDHDSQWINDFLKSFVAEISKPVNEEADRSFDYLPTQYIAEYIRKLGFDGICFKSSVGNGINSVFFCGPDLEVVPNAYGYLDEVMSAHTSMLDEFTKWFAIESYKEYICEK